MGTAEITSGILPEHVLSLWLPFWLSICHVAGWLGVFLAGWLAGRLTGWCHVHHLLPLPYTLLSDLLQPVPWH